jgi:hypothetical protein
VKQETLTALVSLPQDAVFMSTELTQVAEALFKGVSVIYIDAKK